MRRLASLLLAFTFLSAQPALLRAGSAAEKATDKAKPAKATDDRDSPPEIPWHSSYAKAMDVAEKQGRMLLIYFCDPGNDEPCRRFKAETLDDPDVCDKLREYVCVRIPLDAAIKIDGEDVVLLEHRSFKEMLGKPGIAIADFANAGADHYGHVVSTFPITKKLWYTPERMVTILTLPPGTLTQRTLIYAVRIHPDKPSSTDGRVDSRLAGEAEKHSRYQARIRRQGHHHWDRRFRRINTRLPRGLVACEVCAESWPGENLVEAAVECVRCWRLSEGHWSAVRAFHRVYGYDIKRGPNGIWYATGIFGKG